MALFKSKEEKQDEREAKIQELLDKYGVGDLNDPQDRMMMYKIATGLAGSGMMEFGNALAPNQQTFWRLQNTYLSAVMEQNFVIIRQLDKIAKLMEKEG